MFFFIFIALFGVLFLLNSFAKVKKSKNDFSDRQLQISNSEPNQDDEDEEVDEDILSEAKESLIDRSLGIGIIAFGIYGIIAWSLQADTAKSLLIAFIIGVISTILARLSIIYLRKRKNA